jgi:hypothetical protein
MPKIQLSALATDMKGKSGGSVFARNKGGLYFRNNPGAVQKKSFAWQNQKSRFTALSTSWRSLSNEERIAWEQMAENYPAQDAWGNSYIPSGYQLYMRLNGTLTSYNLDLLTTPNSPGSWPGNYDEISMYSPELDVFTPKKCATLRGYNGNNLYLLSKNYLDSVDMSGLNHLAMRFIRDTSSRYVFRQGNIVRLYSMLDSDNYGSFAGITFNAKGQARLVVVYNYASPDYQYYSQVNFYDINTQWNSGAFHFTFYANMNADDPEPNRPKVAELKASDAKGTVLQSRVYCDGVLLEKLSVNYYDEIQDPYSTELVPTGNEIGVEESIVSTSWTATLRVGDYSQNTIRALNVSDIRFYDILAMGEPCGCESGADCPDDYDCRDCECFLVWDDKWSWNDSVYAMIYHGYIIGNETAITPLNEFFEAAFHTYSVNDSVPNMVLTDDEDCCDPEDSCKDFIQLACEDCCCIVVNEEEWITPNINYTFTPFVLITTEHNYAANFALAVYSTKPIGLGRSDFNSPKRLICTILPHDSIILDENNSEETRIVRVPQNSRTFNISAQLRSIIPSVPADTKLCVSYGIINADTGESEVFPAKKPRKNVIRFKAGSELSSSVN